MPARRPQRIFLTGFSFSGKSLVAPLVAQALRWRPVDLDDLIEEVAGMPVPQIFAGEGEPGFRRRPAAPPPEPPPRGARGRPQPLYALADCTVHTDDLSPEQVAAEVVRAWRR